MTRTIWKYLVMTEDSLRDRRRLGQPRDRVELQMPGNSHILSLQVQHGWPVLWAEVQPDRMLVTRYFAIVGTGNPVPDDVYSYVGTWQQVTGEVFHLYETYAPAEIG